MPMLMVKCKTCGEVFGGVYVEDSIKGNNDKVKKGPDGGLVHTCSRGHENMYAAEDYMDWS